MATNGTSDREFAFKKALENNKAWASKLRETDPNFLPELAKGQAPPILWIGCSDSRVPPEIITGLQPGQLFVTRNIANLVDRTDLSSISVIEYACAHLKVQHIVLCGHSGCGGIKGALSNKSLGKIDTWLSPIRQIRLEHLKELDCLPSEEERTQKLVELNVRYGVKVLRENNDVIRAQMDRGLQIHGVVYDMPTGELHTLNIPDHNKANRLDVFSLE